jgi:hypothetical protein
VFIEGMTIQDQSGQTEQNVPDPFRPPPAV